MNGVIAIAGVTLLVTLVNKFTDFLKSVVNKETNTYVTQIIVWVAAIAGVFLVAASQFASGVQITDTLSLDNIDTVTKVIVGLLIGSGASSLFDFKKAIDGTDSAVVTKLLSGGGDS